MRHQQVWTPSSSSGSLEALVCVVAQEEEQPSSVCGAQIVLVSDWLLLLTSRWRLQNVRMDLKDSLNM